MAILQCIRNRYSCRSYQDRPVEADKLGMILEAGRLAPSAKNMQDWRFVVVTENQTRAALARAAYEQMFLAKAAAIIVACSNSDYVMRCGQAIGPIDVAIALEHMCLQAVELGLAGCWIGSFYPEKIKTLLQIPKDIAIIELLAIGYPADKYTTPQRQPLKNIVCYEKWQF